MPAGEAAAEHRVKGSRFRARAAPAETADEARKLRRGARRAHHDATHHVYAWRGLEGAGRFDDDGEPSGTGGRPVLSALEAADLRRAAVVVIRWFGGTELGTGGLARAYRDAARAALERLPVREVLPGRRIEVRHDYGDTGAVAGVLERSGAVRRGASYGTGVSLEVAVPLGEVESVVRALRDVTGGRAITDVSDDVVLVPRRG